MSSLRTLHLSLTLVAVCGAVAALEYDDPLQPRQRVQYQVTEPDPANYTDLRFTYLFLANDAEAEGRELAADRAFEWNSARRYSLMTYGPICSAIPINCFTPSRVPRDRKPPAIISWGEDKGWDILGGLELTYTAMSIAQRVVAPIRPDVDYQNIGVNWHVLGLGVEFACHNGWRVHLEGNPWIGIGYTEVEWANAAIPVPGGTLQERLFGMSFELGGRIGLYATTPIGLQLGCEARYIWNTSALSDGVYLSSVDTEILAPSFGLSLGYRF
ncbi:MAG: hypothetical protein RMM29_05990 [Planctomycetota bacterium]|nr:hypothetical protein [Planctomycetota bacterium]MCX8040435.1 hypothetical protein [Planctomycetota bacterium]MDW8373183.1 hypothetical protein [Planctomycetota bacterium]